MSETADPLIRYLRCAVSELPFDSLRSLRAFSLAMARHDRYQIRRCLQIVEAFTSTRGRRRRSPTCNARGHLGAAASPSSLPRRRAVILPRSECLTMPHRRMPRTLLIGTPL